MKENIKKGFVALKKKEGCHDFYSKNFLCGGKQELDVCAEEVRTFTTIVAANFSQQLQSLPQLE